MTEESHGRIWYGVFTETEKQAYLALEEAARRIGKYNCLTYISQIKRNRQGRVVSGYCLTPAHQDVQDMFARLCHHEATPDEAMTLLRRADVEAERFGGKLNER
jgi:hypothetical protein